jgi:HPt (histidine-containing phosphotransfer) domain-containing protein
MNTQFESDALMARCGQKKELVLKLIDIVRHDIPIQLEKIDHGLNSSNLEAIIQAAHKIKGSSLNLGLPLLKEAAATLEQAGKSEQSINSSTYTLAEELKFQWQTVEPILASF